MKKVLYILFFIFIFSNCAFADVQKSISNSKESIISTQKDKYSELNLTQEQREFFAYIEKEKRNELSLIASKLKRKNMELEALILSQVSTDDFSLKSRTLESEISKLCQDALNVRKKTEGKLLAILDEKQKEAYKKIYSKNVVSTQTGAASDVQQFKYEPCNGENGVGACKIEDLLKKNDKKSN